MRAFKILLSLLILGSALGVLLLFVYQNMDQVIELGLNLGPLGAWRLASPQPAVFVILGAFAIGLVCVGLFAVYEVVLFERRSRRLKALVRELGGGSRLVDEGFASPKESQ